MKKLKIEDFIQEQRDAFDTEMPPAHLWKGVEKALEGKEPPPAQKTMNIGFFRRPHFKYAAAVMLLVCGIGIGYNFRPTAESNDPTAMLSNISPASAQQVATYKKDIDQRYNELAHFAEHRESVKSDLEQMEMMMADLERELADVPNDRREQVVEAIIENYKARLAILERVLKYIKHQDSENLNNNKNDKQSI